MRKFVAKYRGEIFYQKHTRQNSQPNRSNFCGPEIDVCDALRDLVGNAFKRCSNGWPKRSSNQLECVRMARSGKRFSESVCMAFKFLFDI